MSAIDEPVLFRDAEEIQPAQEHYDNSNGQNPYPHVQPPRFIACGSSADDIWLAKPLEAQEETAEIDDRLNLRRRAEAAFRKKALEFLDHSESLPPRCHFPV